MVAVHSTARGPSLGGCRMWTYGDPWAAAMDAVRLSRAMTYKSAVAGLPLGGGKGVVMLPAGSARPTGDERRAVLLDFADTVEAVGGAYVTAEDVGTSEADMRVIAEGTDHVSGLSEDRGGSGDPSPWTALGVEYAIRVACERTFGTDALEGRTIAVVGLGHVGEPLAELLAAARAELLLADIDPGRRGIADRLGAQWTDPESALRADVDLVAPCALGGVLDEASVPELRCRAVAGAANNQLAHDGIAALLAARGILWVPDFVVNAGGVINISAEFDEGGYSRERAAAKVAGIADTVRTILDEADEAEITPLAAALELGRRRVEEAGQATVLPSDA